MSDSTGHHRQKNATEQSSRGAIFAALTVAVVLSAGALFSQRPPQTAAAPAISEPSVSQDRCAECHSDITDGFSTAPHARTLRPATDEDVLSRFAGKTFHREQPEIDYQYELRDGRLWLSSPGYGRDVPVDWLFGSGTHAQTPLILTTDPRNATTSIEHSVSWYPHQGLGISLGTEGLDVSKGNHALGAYRGAPETLACFECHSTYVPVQDGQIQFDKLRATIGCSRCHWDTTRHVAEMDQGVATSIERFSELTPLESVNRCGECHRRADEVLKADINRDNKTIARFASVGLVQSPCFLQQDEVTLPDGTPARMDCTTCHNPHRPAESDWKYYREICHQCHRAEHDGASLCALDQPGIHQSNCLTCHMPKVAIHPLLKFTDHWIRIREDVPTAIDREADESK